MPKGIVKKRTQPKKAQPDTQPDTLKGWQQIAAFLGHPAAVVQRWASEGMPVRRQGRYVETTPDELNVWLGRESGKPVHVATETTDLAAELKRGPSFGRGEKHPKAKGRQRSFPFRSLQPLTAFNCASCRPSSNSES